MSVWLSWTAGPVGASERLPLQLEVYINGHTTNLIGAFEQQTDGRISIVADELRELGLKPPAGVGPEDSIAVDDLGYSRVVYDEAAQAIHIWTDDNLRLSTIYDAQTRSGPFVPARDAAPGAVLNYSLFGTASQGSGDDLAQFNAVSANLDARIFGPLGTLSASGIARTDGFGAPDSLRLDTTWSYSDQETLMTYRAGDMISSAPDWARPIRMGGVQAQRNFALRPDLVTGPLPAVSGSAAVPSTVDIFVNNVRAHSVDVNAGPFTITNIPSISGAGEARVVVRDASGKEIETRAPFYASTALLREGLFDFSAQAGVARRDYAFKSNGYDDQPLGTATLRYGLRDDLTFEGHAEASSDLVLAGGGFTAPLFGQALVTAAGSASIHDQGEGALVYGAIQVEIFGLNLSATSMRVFGEYLDLAAITAKAPDFNSPFGQNAFVSSAFPEALDRVSLGLPLSDHGAGLNFSYVHTRAAGLADEHIVSAGYSQSLFGRATLYASAVAEIDHLSEPSIFVGLSMPLGDRGSVSTGASHDRRNGWQAQTSYSRSATTEAGSWGYRLRDAEGRIANRQAGVRYVGSSVVMEGNAAQAGEDFNATASIDGAVAIAGGGVFASRRIEDAFAVVDVGAPDVEVRYENRPAGRSGPDGKILLTGLRSYERNRITIDPTNLPVNADIPKTEEMAVPPDRAGIVVGFGVKESSPTAVVILKLSDGSDVPTGSEGRLSATGEPFIVGYDGRAYIEGLSERNTITVETGRGICSASFEFTPLVNSQVEIGPLICQ